MRKAKRNPVILPYLQGLITAVIITLVLALGAAFLLFVSDSYESGSGAAAVLIMSIACFFAGRKAGKQKRRGGLKCGALCGLMYFSLLIIPSVILGFFGGIMMFVKLALCLCFGAAGGVVGVNSED